MISWRRDSPDKRDYIEVWDGSHTYSTRAVVPLMIAARDFLDTYHGEAVKITLTNLSTGKTHEAFRNGYSEPPSA